MKATGRADLAADEKVLDLYTSNLQLEDQLHGVRKEVEDAKSLAEKVSASLTCLATKHQSVCVWLQNVQTSVPSHRQ